MSSYLNLKNIHYHFLSKHSERKKKKKKNESSTEFINEDSDVIQKVENVYKYILSLTPQEKKNFLLSLKISRGFKSPHHYSASVYLLDNYIVRKNLKSNVMGNFLFQNEISALKKLQPYNYFPKLLGYDNRRLSIFMTFCGEQISSKNLPEDWEKQIDDIETILTNVNVNSNDMILRNVCVLNKRIYIIDFGLYSQFSVSIKETISKLKYDLRNISVNKKKLLYNI